MNQSLRRQDKPSNGSRVLKSRQRDLRRIHDPRVKEIAVLEVRRVEPVAKVLINNFREDDLALDATILRNLTHRRREGIEDDLRASFFHPRPRWRCRSRPRSGGGRLRSNRRQEGYPSSGPTSRHSRHLHISTSCPSAPSRWPRRP